MSSQSEMSCVRLIRHVSLDFVSSFYCFSIPKEPNNPNIPNNPNYLNYPKGTRLQLRVDVLRKKKIQWVDRLYDCKAARRLLTQLLDEAVVQLSHIRNNPSTEAMTELEDSLQKGGKYDPCSGSNSEGRSRVGSSFNYGEGPVQTHVVSIMNNKEGTSLKGAWCELAVTPFLIMCIAVPNTPNNSNNSNISNDPDNPKSNPDVNGTLSSFSSESNHHSDSNEPLFIPAAHTIPEDNERNVKNIDIPSAGTNTDNKPLSRDVCIDYSDVQKVRLS